MGTELEHPLAGKSAWIITDGKTGHEVQMRGVADALGVAAQIKPITPASGLYKLTAPYGPPPVSVRFGVPGSAFGPPWPAIAFATGRLTTPYIRALKKRAGLATYTVILLDPKTRANSADLFWVPEHDTRRGANVVTTLTSPHGFGPKRLADLRGSVPAAIAALPQPRIAVLIGGPNGDYRYETADFARLAAALSALAKTGAGLMLTTSRRTPRELLDAVETATAGAARILYTGGGDNPYANFLAHADAFVVTADSVNMAGEAAATGKPIHVFHPAGGSAKFSRFHASLEAQGITRRLERCEGPLAAWAYEPVDAAEAIAREIGRRYRARLDMMPGLMLA